MRQSITESFGSSQKAGTVRRTNFLLRNSYLWMALGLALTGLVGWLAARSPNLVLGLCSSLFGLFAVVAVQFGLVIYLGSRLDRMSAVGAIAAFILYSAVSGLTLSSIFLVYAGAVVAKAFLSACLMFAGMGLYGMVARRPLDSWGSHLAMGLWGLVAATLLNLIFRSGALDFAISFVGVGIFLALTAWDTRKIVRLGWRIEGADEDSYVKLSVVSALTLYLDFFNIFLYLLRLFGRNSDR